MHIDRPIAIALILFFILLLVFFLVWPEFKVFRSLQQDLGKKQAEYAAKYDYYSAIEAAYFNLKSRDEDVQKVDDALPKDSDFGQLIFYLQEIAKENGLIVKDVFLSKTSISSSNTVKNVIFSLDLIGGYSSLENFIASLEKSSRIFEVVNISFGSVTGPPYSFSLQIKTYSY